MVLSELLDLAVLLDIRFTLILNVVVQCDDDLLAFMDLGGQGHELESHSGSVVVGHAMVRRESDIIARLDHLPRCESNRVSLYNLLGQGLGCLRCRLERRKDSRGGRVVELVVEGIPSMLGGRCVRPSQGTSYRSMWKRMVADRGANGQTPTL